MIIIINKLQIHGKRFCENCVTGSNLWEVQSDALSHRERARIVGRVSAAPPDNNIRSENQPQLPASPAAARCLPSSGTGR